MARLSSLVCVAPSKVSDVWPHVEKMIDDAYAAVDQITPDVRTWLIEEKGLLWIAVAENSKIVAALTTSLVQRRSGLACRMVAAGGEGIDYCLPHLDEIELYAEKEGCYKIVLEGRSGWKRVFTGYKPVSVKMEKII